MESEREPKIKKAVLNGRQLTVVYTEFYPEGEKDITVKSEIPVHKDCTDAFKRLVPHFILLTEMKESDKVSRRASDVGIENIGIGDDDDFKNADVYGIKLGKNDNNTDTVTLMGERFLQMGGSVDFSSLAQELESSGSEFEYPYINELSLAIQAVLYEVKEYLFNGKYAVTQTTLDFEVAADVPFEAGKMVDTDAGTVTPITIEKPKRGRKPKRESKAVAAAC